MVSIHAEVVSRSNTLEQTLIRTPVIETLPNHEREWHLLTEIARRSISSNADFRKMAVTFSKEPLSEELPGSAIDQMSAVDQRMLRVKRLTANTLGGILGLPALDDSLLQPDIKNAPTRKPDNEHGISDAEKELVTERYRYARDIKLLGLMAELYDNPMDVANQENGIIRQDLPSGTKLGITQEAHVLDGNLLNPEAWESRRKIKDRVFEVVIGGKQYILKERKSNRHADTLGTGHRDGLSSEEEFMTGLEFAKNGVTETEEINVHWETPLGFVEFPDGYQFCLFDFEPDLDNTSESLRGDIQESILNNPESFEAEYRHIAQEAEELYKERPDLVRQVDPSATVGGRKGFAKIFGRRNESMQLSYRDFAELKSHYLKEQIGRIYSDTMIRLGYQSSDLREGMAAKLRYADKKMIVDVIGFDYEYFEKDVDFTKIISEKRREMLNDGNNPMALLDFYQSGAGQPAIKHAASFVMLRNLGQALPGVKRKPGSM